MISIITAKLVFSGSRADTKAGDLLFPWILAGARLSGSSDPSKSWTAVVQPDSSVDRVWARTGVRKPTVVTIEKKKEKQDQTYKCATDLLSTSIYRQMMELMKQWSVQHGDDGDGTNAIL